MATWQAPALRDDMGIEELKNLVAMLLKELDYIFGGFIDFKNIRVDGIETKNLKAGIITTEKLGAGAVTADKITVNELSAISANMGTITAGSISASANIDVGTDARIGNILYLKEIDASGQKGIIFSNVAGASAKISVLSGDLSIITDGYISFTIGSSQGLTVNNKISAPNINATSSLSVNNVAVATSADLATKADAFTGYTGSIAVNNGANTMNFNNGILTSIT